MSKAEIGVVGLGVMGANLSLNIADKGHRVAVIDVARERTEALVAEAGPLAGRIVPCFSHEELAAAIEPPRPVILMVPAGHIVDELIEDLKKVLGRGDIIVDAGNANFRDTRRRMEALKESGLQYVGMGVSGGAEGARHGPSMMVGGPREAYRRIEPVLADIAARYDGEPCQAWLGPDGAGHLVKTIHNGIEYADMQMIAEIYGILRDGFGMKPDEIAGNFAEWDKGRLNSYLIEITATVLDTIDPQSGKPLVEVIEDRAGQKGTGRWSVIEAQRLGVPATAMEAAVAARSLSAHKDERVEAEKAFGPLPQPAGKRPGADLLDQLERALLAGKIVAYAQGFSVMAAASQEFSWNLPLATIARIWRAGCIIRSAFLDRIAAAFEDAPDTESLLLTPDFRALMGETHEALARTVALCATSALAAPALSAALAHFDGYRRARGTANQIQGQRDFFGAHGFGRIGEEGQHHGPCKRD
jgi:6-phosphogluconate dehydrogenase